MPAHGDRRPVDDGRQRAAPYGLPQGPSNPARRHEFAFHPRREHPVVHLGHGSDQVLVAERYGGDLGLSLALTGGTGQLDDAGRQPAAYLRQHTADIGAGSVQLVHEQDGRHPDPP